VEAMIKSTFEIAKNSFNMIIVGEDEDHAYRGMLVGQSRRVQVV
jgi:hypothetical protein